MLVSANTDFKTDIGFGLRNQSSILSTLQGKFGTSIVETTDKFCKWDFEDSDGNHYEMKSRRTSKGCYPTTLLPCHKVMKTQGKQFFVFRYTDKVCFIQYDKILFDTFETGLITDARTYQNDLHFYIPVGLLVDI